MKTMTHGKPSAIDADAHRKWTPAAEPGFKPVNAEGLARSCSDAFVDLEGCRLGQCSKVGSYRGNTGRAANAVPTAALDPKLTSLGQLACIKRAFHFPSRQTP
jgi:hypothetical protein